MCLAPGVLGLTDLSRHLRGEHDMRLVWAVSNRILLLNYGCKLAEGTGAEVRANREVVAAYFGEGGRDL